MFVNRRVEIVPETETMEDNYCVFVTNQGIIDNYIYKAEMSSLKTYFQN